MAGSADMRQIVRLAAEGEPRAVLGMAVYDHRLRAAIASMAAAMGGIDALVFCGGVGEHAPAVRAPAASGLAFLGVGVAPSINEDGIGERDITAPGSVVATLVVEAREDLEIARQVHSVLTETRASQRDPPERGR